MHTPQLQNPTVTPDRTKTTPVRISDASNISHRIKMICTESQATVVLGELKADLVEYDISSWTEDGVVADNEGDCGIGHRLSLDFKSNSVTVTDYPKRVLGGDCKPFQDASSYALHGGGLILSPPAAWDPLAKPAGKK